MTQIFQSVQSTLGHLQMFAPKPFDTFNRFNWKRSLILLYLIVYTVLTSLCFIPAQTFSEYYGCMFIVLTAIATSFITATLYCYIPDIFTLINDCQNGIDARQENPQSRAIYKETNETIEKYCSMIWLWFVRVTVNGALGMNLALALFTYFTTGLDEYDYNFPHPLWFPFKKTLYEYAFEFVIEYVGLSYVMIVPASVMSLLVSTCLLIMSIIKDLRAELASLSAIDMTNENMMVIRKKIFGFIRLHIHAKQCASKFVDIYQFIFTAYFIWSLIAICASLLYAQNELSKDAPDYDILLIVFLYAVYAFGLVFLFCEFSQQLTNRFELLYDDIYQFNWHLLPLDLQRTWNIVLVTAQQPVQLTSFGNVICNREIFQRIVNSSFSFFMIFREFS